MQRHHRAVFRDDAGAKHGPQNRPAEVSNRLLALWPAGARWGLGGLGGASAQARKGASLGLVPDIHRPGLFPQGARKRM